MIVCVCQAVSDGEVKATIRHGASSLAEVTAACGAGGDCGSCCDMICTMLQQERGVDLAAREQHHSQPLVVLGGARR